MLIINEFAKHKNKPYTIYQFNDGNEVYYNFNKNSESGYYDLSAMLRIKGIRYTDLVFNTSETYDLPSDISDCGLEY